MILGIVYFYRKPIRYSVINDNTIITSPADGEIVAIEPIYEERYFGRKVIQVSIFLSPLDVHYQWCPINGKVVYTDYQKGNHNHARLPKSSSENERSLIVIKVNSGTEIAVRQIAGALARRVVTYIHDGEYVNRNTLLGLIKLGSRVDLYLPINTNILVKNGDRVIANKSIIGKLM